MSTVLFGVLIVLALIAWFFAKKAAHLLRFAINSIIGVLALMGWNLLFPPLPITIISVLLVAIGGIFGFIAVGLFTWFGFMG